MLTLILNPTYYEKRFDGLLYGLIGPSGPMASHVSEDSLEQVQLHLVSLAW